MSSLRLALILVLTLDFMGSLGCRKTQTEVQEGSNNVQDRFLLSNPDAVQLDWKSKLQSVRASETKRIEVDGYPVTAVQLAELVALSGLSELLLDQGVVDDGSIDSYISRLDLVHFRARFSPITDDGFVALVASQKNLRILNLPQAILTKRAFQKLDQTPPLTFLRIGGPGIDDDAIYELSKKTQLRHLHLVAPQLTDRSLEFIAAMDSLDSFYLDDCRLSDKAWEKLFQARPKLHVHIDQAHHDRDPHPLHDSTESTTKSGQAVSGTPYP